MIAYEPAVDERLLTAFQKAARDLPWYRTLLAEQGVEPSQVTEMASFGRVAPLLSRQNTFDRFGLHELSSSPIDELAGVLTSSGHGGRFSFGLTTKADAARAPDFFDTALDAAFEVKSRRTLTINCLPMGVGFSSRCTTVATTSVREDMAVAIVERFASHFDQVLLVADPLFTKRLTDLASERSFDWSRHRVHLLLGEEIFGEHFRTYVAACLGQALDTHDGAYTMSSLGVGELGLHLCYETRATIAVRRAAAANEDFAREVLGAGYDGTAVPTVLSFNPLRTYIEAVESDAAGYGRLAISMLDPQLPVQLLRYQTGDIARMLDANEVAAAARRHGVELWGELPATLLALKGRDREELPNGSHVGLYKDALYADHDVAKRLTGAVRLTFDGTVCSMHAQLNSSAPAPSIMASALLATMPAAVRPRAVVLWPYERFPFGMRLDYERKFTYHAGADTARYRPSHT